MNQRGYSISRSILSLGFITAFLCFASALSAIDVPLRYLKYPEKQEAYFPGGLARMNKSLRAPTGIYKYPEFISKKPIYVRVKLGAEERLIIMDKQKPSDDFYNRIYFDANANNDLTDDPVIDGTLESDSRQFYQRVKFPPVDTAITLDGKSLPYSFIPEFFARSRLFDETRIDEAFVERAINCYLRTNCLYKGTFEVDGEAYHVSLSDSNCNGIFGEKFELRKFERPIPGRMPIFAAGDGIFLSRGEEIHQYTQQIVGDWLLVRNKLFEMSVNQANERLSLTPMTENLASLKLAMQAEHISLYTEDGKHFLMACRPEKNINVPRGKYRLYSYNLLENDDQGDLWSLTARATTESPWVIAKGSADADLAFGEPYLAAVDVPDERLVNVQGSTSARTSAFLLFTVRGKGNEDIIDLTHERGDKTRIPLSKKKGLTHRPKEPTYRILRPDGKTAAQGSFEYG